MTPPEDPFEDPKADLSKWEAIHRFGGYQHTQVVLDADGATLRTKLRTKLSSYFPQNNLSPVEIDWAAEAVDRDIFALVSKSTSK